MALIEKLTLKDTFKIWRDKINALIDSIHQQPYTDEEGNYVINEKYTDATRVLMEIPLKVTSTVEAKKFIGELEGNASTATKLETARLINDSVFDGTNNIVTSIWGTTRAFKITDASGINSGGEIEINGSKDYILKLPSTIRANVDGSTTTAKALEKAVQINGIKFNGTDNVINYGTCETASDDEVKAVKLFSRTTEFMLVNGATISVKFLSKNKSTDQLYLNVEGTGAKPIYAYGAPIDPDIIDEGTILTFVYDGASYNLTSLDKRVRQKRFFTNNEYPLLASTIVKSAVDAVAQNEECVLDDYTFFTSGITINPSNNSLKIAGDVTSDTLTTITSVTTPDLTSSSTLSITSTDNLTISAKAVSITKGNLNVSNALNVIGKTTLDTAYVNVLQTKYNNSTINIIENGVVRNAIYNNDYAEFFPRGEETEPGDIVALDENSQVERYIKATDKSKLVVGVHSNTYGYILGGEETLEESEKTHIPVGLSGRVYVKFKGKSILGEGVVPSDTPGVGRLYDDLLDSSRKIVGYIVEDTNPSSKEERLVKVLINR